MELFVVCNDETNQIEQYLNCKLRETEDPLFREEEDIFRVRGIYS